MEKEKIAVIGSGISGLSASFFLSNKYKVFLFEKNDCLGGHTRTKQIKENNKYLNIDTGFIVFNNHNYPDLVKFFNLLGIETSDSEMSFSISIKKIDLEYGSNGFNSIFAKKKNIFSIFFWKLLIEIFKFYNQCKNNHQLINFRNYTLEDFLKKFKYSSNLRHLHIYPMIAAIWSCNKNNVKELPLTSFINFFNNHKLFNFKSRPQWKFVKGGSYNYVQTLINKNKFNHETKKEVKKILRENNFIKIIFNDDKQFIVDKVILATHADQALRLLEYPTIDELNILSKFKYTKNKAYLHSDQKMMPKNKNVWSSWNFIANESKQNTFSLTYWMNRLQNIDSTNNYFVSINPNTVPSKYYDKTVFEHPIFNLDTLEAQKNLSKIQGVKNTYYCGSYFGYGFHEDGIQSSASVSKLLNADLPWKREDNFYNRIY